MENSEEKNNDVEETTDQEIDDNSTNDGANYSEVDKIESETEHCSDANRRLFHAIETVINYRGI